MPIKVVYLDDEECLCELFKEYLHSDLINVEVFSNENEAIQHCNKHNPDIIFIDYRLKTKTGVEVSQAITSNTLKILVTGEFGIKTDKSFAKIIEKPFKLAEIKTLILNLKE